ncbi:endospore germination permease [Clostridiaceae bacterium M8S5]|nr:endospore germination permease [Clostridiaceae bacterium M8S5]
MNENSLSESQATRMLILFFLGSSLALHNASPAKQDNWLAILIATFLALPLLYMFSYTLTSITNAKTYFDVHKYVYGRYLGSLINISYVVSGFFLGATITREYGEYLITTSMPQTPLIIPLIIMILLGAWIVKEGITVLGRWCNLFFFINAPLPTIIFLLTIPLINVENILPIMYNGVRPVIEGSIVGLELPFSEAIMIFTIIFTLPSKKSYYKVFTKSILISGITLAGVTLIQIMVLGFDLYMLSYFPSHDVVSNISLGKFVERLEIIMLIATTTAGFVKVCIGLFSATNGIANMLKIENHKLIVIPCSLLVINLSYFINSSIIDLMDMYFLYWKYYILVICIFIPTTTFLILLFKIKILKKKPII